MSPQTQLPDTDLQQRFRSFVRAETFPCVGAKAALSRDMLIFHVARSIDDPADDLERALAPYGIESDVIPTAFNIFMHVDGKTGEIRVLPPLSRAGQRLVLRAEMDMIVAMTACSAGQSNNFQFKPIDYEVTDTPPEWCASA